MKSELLYVELKQGHSGPAWIGHGQFSKSGQTVYFDGKVLKKGQGISSNHFDIDTGEEYWISGVKKRGTNRHTFGSGKIYIDITAVDEYLQLTGLSSLPKKTFILTELIRSPNKQLSNEIENTKITKEKIDNRAYHKEPNSLNNEELKELIDHYSTMDPTQVHLKARKSYRDKLNTLILELEKRNKTE